MPLTDIKLRALQPAEKPFKISDASGLNALVNPSGSKLWRYACRFEGRQKLLALGAFPDVSLGEARQARDSARELLLAATPLLASDHSEYAQANDPSRQGQ